MKIRRTALILPFLLAGTVGGGFFFFQSSSAYQPIPQPLSEDSETGQELIAVNNSSTDTTAAAKEKVQVGSEDTVLYSEPSKKSKEVTEVNRGEYLDYIEESEGWYHVTVNDMYEGYISANDSQKITIEEKAVPDSLEDMTVVLNPGHGGDDTGALSIDETLYEKDLTLETAETIQAVLVAAGCTVILTRESDETESLDEICAASIHNQADVFISLHYDSTEYRNEGSGTTTYYYYEKYAALAETVNDQLAYSLPLENRGMEYGNYQVLRENTQPALLLELGYMNNESDLAYFSTKSYQEQAAKAILKGLENYLQEA